MTRAKINMIGSYSSSAALQTWSNKCLHNYDNKTDRSTPTSNFFNNEKQASPNLPTVKKYYHIVNKKISSIMKYRIKTNPKISKPKFLT